MFYALILAPIRALFDLIKLLYGIICTIIRSKKLYLIVSIIIIGVLWVFNEEVILLMVIVLEILRFFLNIYLLVLNIIIQLLYVWIAPLYNEVIFFVSFVYQGRIFLVFVVLFWVHIVVLFLSLLSFRQYILSIIGE